MIKCRGNFLLASVRRPRFCETLRLSGLVPVRTEPSSAIAGKGLVIAMIATLKYLSGKLLRKEDVTASQALSSLEGRYPADSQVDIASLTQGNPVDCAVCAGRCSSS